MWMLLGMALLLGMATSTREQREEAGRRLARHNPKFTAVALVIWGAILLPELWRLLRPP